MLSLPGCFGGGLDLHPLLKLLVTSIGFVVEHPLIAFAGTLSVAIYATYRIVEA